MPQKFILSNQASSIALGKVFSSQQGTGIASSDQMPTVLGPSTRNFDKDGAALTWYSPPVKAISVSGPINFNLWGRESNLTANAGFYVEIDNVTALAGFIGSILHSAEGVELGTSDSVHNWSATPGAPVSIAEGTRIRVRVFYQDAGGTMAAGQSVFFKFAAPTTLDGDSWIQFTEDISLVTYPTVSQDGPHHLHYLKRKKDYKAITVESKFEDGGVDRLEYAADAPQIYELTYDGLADTDTDVLDAFYDAHRLTGFFTFIEPRNEPWTGIEGDSVEVRFDSYDGDHIIGMTQSRKAVLIKTPA